MSQFHACSHGTLEWVDWFNHRRLLEAIDTIPPAEAEAIYYANQENLLVAALLKPKGLWQTRGGSPFHMLQDCTGSKPERLAALVRCNAKQSNQP